MSGKVFRPSEWYIKKLQQNPQLANFPIELNALRIFVDFLESSSLFMSVIGSGRDTKNSSIYNANSTDKRHWICDIKFFNGDAFATDIEVVCKEKMNVVNDVYENQEFASIIEIITNTTQHLGSHSSIKKQIDLINFCNALKEIEKAIKVYKIFR